MCRSMSFDSFRLWPDYQALKYYRRLCAHYIGEARRWHKVALKSPEVQKAYEVLR